MKFRSVQQKTDRTPEDVARIKAIREKFQKERPTVEQLLQNEDYGNPIPLGAYLETKELLHKLKQEREQAGLSLAEVAERTGMDKAAISRLENGHQDNPTVDTLSRYALAIGKQIILGYVDLPRAKRPKQGGRSPTAGEETFTAEKS
jgi:DNA-binding XRE family transcriptional regulator